MENEQADAGRNGRTRLARPNSQAQTRTGKYSFGHEQDWQPYPVDLYSATVCMVTYRKSMDQPGKVANPARGQMNISRSAFVPENLVSRDGFGSPVPRQPAHLHTQAESGAYLRDSSRVPRRHPFTY